MPLSEDFKLEILINKRPIHEYVDKKTGKVFVESNLYSSISYLQKITEKIEGQNVTQNVPVTPYEIRLTTSNKARGQYFRILVDGIKIKGMSITPGKEKYVTGFRDGNKVRELLFSLPNMTEHRDRITNVNRSEIGTISVECWKGILRARVEDKRNPLKFTQATKKDAYLVTKGQSLLPTSCAGKTIEKKKDTRSVDKWSLEKKMSTLTVHYRMANELTALGFTVAGGNIAAPDIKEKRISDPERKRPLAAVIDLTGDDAIEEKVRRIDVISIENEKNQAESNRSENSDSSSRVIYNQTKVKIEDSGDIENLTSSGKLDSVANEEETQNESYTDDSREVSTLIEESNNKSESDKNDSINSLEEDMEVEEEPSEGEQQDEENDKEEAQPESIDEEEQTDMEDKDEKNKANEEYQKNEAEAENKPNDAEDQQNEKNAEDKEDQQNVINETDQKDEAQVDDQQNEANEKDGQNDPNAEENQTTLNNEEEKHDNTNREQEENAGTDDRQKSQNSIENINSKNPSENIAKASENGHEEVGDNHNNSESFDTEQNTEKQKPSNESFTNMDASQNLHSVSQLKATSEESDNQDNCVLSEADEDDGLMSTSSTVIG